MELVHQPEEIISERYRIIDTLGQGGSGTTYLAENLQSGERVALKALSLRRMTDWKMMELFEREVKILSQINHPRIPHYLEYFEIDRESDRSFYIVQQLAKGKSLAAWVETGWRTDEKGVRKIAIQMLNILVYLHHLKPPVIHRDIKPQNIIMQEDGQVFLVDFGAVQDTYHNTFMRGSTVVGTYGYMAPEQFRGQAVPTTDLYGLGATLLFLLTHRSPSDLPTDRLKINFRSRVQISSQFADWLEKMLEPDVEDRFSSAKEALEALRGKRSITSDEDKVSQTFRWQALIGLGVAGVVSVGLLYYYKNPLLNYLEITPTGVFEAARKGNIDPVRHYLERGGNVNAKDKDGRTLMQLSSHTVGASNKVLELLIVKGADVNDKDGYDYTLLHRALMYNWKDIAELLIAKGADVNAKNHNGETPLHMMALNYDLKKVEVAELLIAKGADVNAKDVAGETLLHKALILDLKEVAELLIAKGADVNAKDNNGNTPLHRVWGNNNTKLAELLIAKGADVNAKNNNGKTPLHEAIYNDDVTELLIAKGADVNAKDYSDATPLRLAVKFNQKDVVELLKKHGGKE